MTPPPLATAGRAAVLAGIRDGVGAPGIAIFASQVGFGSLASAGGLSLPLALTATGTIWAMPGQVAFAELAAAGASWPVILIAVSLANARFLPMTVATIPLLRERVGVRWFQFLFAHLVSITSWGQMQLTRHRVQGAARAPYFVAFSATALLLALLGTGIGHGLAGLLPAPAALALAFVPPLYILLMLVAAPQRIALVATALGGALGAGGDLLLRDWGVLLGGVLAGTVAWLLMRRARHG
ncbi:MAG: branched-chain amino acid ABC transporter permease [Alphaproteobacteria bacterium]|nr:branched-chain amino acid ABC transporter permease [Alphaproteobacteria bacterium]